MDVFCHLYALHLHIVHVDLHISPDMLPKHLVYQTLIGCPGVFQSEWLDLVAIQSLVGYEICLLLVHLMHSYLIVSQ